MATVGRLVLRVLVGALFVGHGTQKLFGWFGGQGPDGTGATFESAGLRPGKRNALAAGATEAAGGVLLATGLATPVAASLLSGAMLTATRTVHWERGVWNSKGGYEYPAVILAVVFALAESGPGRASLDAALGQERRGLAWAFAQVGAAAVASHAVVELGRRRVGAAEARDADAPAHQDRLRPAA